MANPEHIPMLQSGALAAARAREPDLVLDLSGANLQHMNFESLDLHGANFSDSNLKATIFNSANLTGANLSHAHLSNARFNLAKLSGANLADADCTSADFTNADLEGIKATNNTILKGANFRDAKVDIQFICQANAAGANFSYLDLTDIDLSGQTLNAVQFEGAILTRANFANAKLREARFSNAQLGMATFDKAELTLATLSGAYMPGGTLRGAILAQANLVGARLSNVAIDGTNFYEANLSNAMLSHVSGARLSLNLKTTRMTNGGPLYFESAIREWPERWVDWERLRIFGRLPLFGVSYTGLIVIPAYVYFLGIYNEKVEAARAFVDQNLGSTAGFPATSARVLAHLHPEPIPESFFLLFMSTLCLAAAATIYTFGCPSRVKHFTRDQWCDELGHSLVHYWPDAWKWRWWRLACGGLYAVGGAGALLVLISKLWWVGVYLFRAQFRL